MGTDSVNNKAQNIDQAATVADPLERLVRRFVSWLKHRLHRCAERGCWTRGNPCFLPDNYTEIPDEWICVAHMFDAGYCSSCGRFWAGVDSFDFYQNGLCDNCYDDAWDQFDEDGYV